MAKNAVSRTETSLWGTKITLTNAYFKCPACRRMRGASHFGLRYHRQSNTIRQQSWCKSCRSKSKR